MTNSTFVGIAAGGFGGATGNLQGTLQLKGTLLADSASGNCAAPESITGVIDPQGPFSVSIASVLQSTPVLKFMS